MHMKKSLSFVALAVMAMLLSAPANAQFLKSLGDAIKQGSNNSSKTTTTQQSQGNQNATATRNTSSSGVVYYVSTNGSGRADGLTPSTPMKDIQKALNTIRDKAQNGATIRVAEGNYLGALDAGYIEIYNFITLEGGWNNSFTERDVLKYQTTIVPTTDQLGTNGSKGVITFKGLDNVNYVVTGTVTIDGILIDCGFETAYYPNDPSNDAYGCPSAAFETGRMKDNPADQPQHQLMWSESAIAGNVIIRNCLFANGPYFGIQINTRCGEIEIYNNVFICNRYGNVRIDGWDRDGTHSHVNFHHNTVAFAWCRDKLMEDMGYGYECMNKVNCDLHHNIFACNNYAAIARTHALSGPDRVIEERKVTNVYDNMFFMNAADLQLPAYGGGKWTNVACANFEDVDEKILPKYEGNKELQKGDSFVEALDQDYLEAFSKIEIITRSSFNANSAANQFRSAMGANLQGTETIRPNMYGNRYKYDYCLKLFGAKAGYGAQKP